MRILLYLSLLCLSLNAFALNEIQYREYVKKLDKCDFAFAMKWDLSFNPIYKNATPDMKAIEGEINDMFYCLGEFKIFKGTSREKEGCFLMRMFHKDGRPLAYFVDADLYESKTSCSPELFEQLLKRGKTHPQEASKLLEHLTKLGASKREIDTAKDQLDSEKTAQALIIEPISMGLPIVLTDSSEGIISKAFNSKTYSNILHEMITKEIKAYHGVKSQNYPRNDYQSYKLCRPELEKSCLETIVKMKKEGNPKAKRLAYVLCQGTKNYQACNMF